ncbi:type III-B CRISPR module-associated protein Cmr5 [Ectothiorhodospira mobilis]|uniref:type III-B CRISPR module-associated protein Cmr5 n=1 Tax=Ectothiorhodospira mobilis TaxID=195064 RepID=UPI001907F2C5|nr:type III-B CRISPR module-associated protein Cmr5 [Ectothiorhodospira mobilis]MBK1692604.1 type III-B CRISPR module-associated protein Cmr5 [Ectothiorhodospira mobilis]
MHQTLDQQRAAFAWEVATQGMQHGGDSYRALAKGAPALIMTSGLMPVLAFYRSKDAHHQRLLDHIIRGISLEFWGPKNAGQKSFEDFMQRLQQADSETYRRATDSALETLKWIRQFVDAVEPAQGGNAR